MMTLSHASGGSPAISSRWIATRWLGEQRLLHRRREAVAVDRERAARRHAMRIGGAHDQRAAAPHLLVQQPDRVVLDIVGAERVGAHQLGEAVGDMRRGAAHRPHLVQHDGHAGARQLPSGLAARRGRRR